MARLDTSLALRWTQGWTQRWAWVWLALVALFAAGIGGNPAAASKTNRPPLVVVNALGDVSRAQMRTACRAILSAADVRCEVRGFLPSQRFASAVDEKRGQLDARAGLERIFRHRQPDVNVHLLLTSHDMFEGRRPFVFGLASLTDRVALVSTARIDPTSPRFESRLTKLVRHEAGHALGLHHHDHEGCVMRSDPTLASLDRAPETFCKECHHLVEQRAHVLARPGTIVLDHARGHLVRGELAAARRRVEPVRERLDLQVLEDIGVSFMQARALDDAVETFQLVVRRSPNRAQARARLGLALRMRGRQGDRQQALRHLEAALRIHPEWKDLRAQVTELRRDLAADLTRAQGPRQ